MKMKFEMPRIIVCERYTQSAANCCSRLFQSACGINYRTSSI